MYDKQGPIAVDRLRKRNFDAWYFPDREGALEKIRELMKEGGSVSFGGSMTASELGLKDLMRDIGMKLILREEAKSEEESERIIREAFFADWFVMSSNAVTMDGQLFNIDGRSTRVAPLCYGPKNVLIVAGMNKVVPDMEAAYKKVRNFTAPANTGRNFPNAGCAKTGICTDCKEYSRCCQLVQTRVSIPQGRIKVILIGEELGL